MQPSAKRERRRRRKKKNTQEGKGGTKAPSQASLVISGEELSLCLSEGPGITSSLEFSLPMAPRVET